VRRPRSTSTKNEKGASLFGFSKLYGQVPGGQAEFLRVPQAQFGPVKVPETGPDERYLFLSDVLPTAWQAVDYAAIPDGGSVAVFGLGPIGQMAARIARHKGAEKVFGIDNVPARLQMARRATGSSRSTVTSTKTSRPPCAS
jgi:threonine dehydrogenase-like Zn-dependent dehydrogenase